MHGMGGRALQRYWARNTKYRERSVAIGSGAQEFRKIERRFRDVHDGFLAAIVPSQSLRRGSPTPSPIDAPVEGRHRRDESVPASTGARTRHSESNAAER